GQSDGLTGSWSTPIVIEGRDSKAELILSAPEKLSAFDPKTGNELWHYDGLNPLIYGSPIYGEGVIVAMGGFQGTTIAVTTGGTGDVTATHKLWETKRTKNRLGCGVIFKGHIYVLNTPGVAECIELKTGKTIWEERLPSLGPKSDSWSSMILSGDTIYVLNQSGDTIILRASPKFEVLATNSIGNELTNASHAVSDGELFIRTHKNLWCIGENKKSASQKKIKALFLTGGGYHDYQKLAPYLTNSLGKILNADFDVRFDMDILKNENFAAPYDVIIYDFCFDEADSALLENAMRATRNGKPAVMIHCAVHAFRKSEKVGAWENYCGMRSKVHDPYQPFATQKVTAHPVTKNFPDDWKTPGDELYQTIQFFESSTPLLKVKSPRDDREHIVCWVHQFGQGRVFATTRGHDMKTVESPEYLRLLADGILWACNKLGETK
ncbi:MAG: ThuA domain-containing protein, partial [Verrucomicrobiota bacterium]|nr:ThuA domain-containing protein [Verrucomicrobiota bacterium]